MADALDQPVCEQARRVRDAGDALTARALVDASLARIARRDGALGSFLRATPELAREQAAAVDEAVAAGEEVGPLAGVPLAVKDNLAWPGVPLTCASRILEGYIPPTPATSLARAVAAGACIVGKTNLDEFAMGSSTENSAFGPTRNPWDPTRVAGGSSGGSAAAVAAGLAPLALGSDTGGSIRQPAAFCGIAGLKPTYGRVSRSGLVAFASSLDQVGPMARTAEDAAILLDAIAGPDPLDATTRTFEHGVLDEADAVGSLRIARVAELEKGVDGEAQAAVEGAARHLAGDGAVASLSLPLVEAGIAVYYLVAPSEASSNLARYDGVRYGRRAAADDLEALYRESRGEGFGPEVKRRIILGTFALSAGYADAYYKKAMAVRGAMRRELARAFETADVLVTATTPTPAFPLGDRVEDPLAMYLSDALTVTANLVGVPALSLPAGLSSDGLPLAVQLWAAWGREDRLLAAARSLEAAGFAYASPPAPAEAS